ncbi:MAG: hypothetical protein GF330_10210 [Candidatus Eisenbacteria bacterium]|nr:hypothetical protein [Candidatus Eisenbacteria bacterium]
MRIALQRRVLGRVPTPLLIPALLGLLAMPLFGGCDDDEDGGRVAACTVSLQAPNGGESYTVADTVAILWSVGEHCGTDVRLDLFQDGDSCAVIADSVAVGKTRYDWVVSACDSDTAGYAIRVRDRLTGASDRSDSSFVIVPVPVCEPVVISPNGSEYWIPGATTTLRWESNELCGDAVTLELLREESVCRTIASGVPNSGSYDWTVTGCGAETEGYRLQITDEQSGISDRSDASFAITPDIPLAAAIAAAGPGEADGHSFAHLVDLDPNARYYGGATITEDTCIRGHGAWVDLFDPLDAASENILVTAAVGTPPPRFDIDHCIVVYGGTDDDFGGAVQYREGTTGRVFQNTFYQNLRPAIYVHPDVEVGEEGLRIYHNIITQNGGCGFVVHYTIEDDIWIRYNCISSHSLGNGCSHCACPDEPIEGWTDVNEHDRTAMNITVDPQFVDPKRNNLNLSPTSPCIGAGENGEDLGALPYEPGRP